MFQNAQEVTVGDVLRAPPISDAFRVVAGLTGLDRAIRQRTVQRLGVALTGYTEHLDPYRVQMIGRSESGYLRSLTSPDRTHLLERIFELNFPAVMVTCGLDVPVELIEMCNRRAFPLLATPLDSSIAADRFNEYLTRRLSPRQSQHGVLVDVYGVGILLLGKSGIGKSEVALELVAAGHRLVADDFMLLQQEQPGALIGTGPELTRYHMEIRGLGIINIKDLFGAAAVRERKRVEMIIELVEWDPHADYDRLGLDTQYMELVGVPIQHITLPVRPGRSLRLIIEVAARNRLLQVQGTHSARAFAERLNEHLERRTEPPAEVPAEGDVE